MALAVDAQEPPPIPVTLAQAEYTLHSGHGPFEKARKGVFARGTAPFSLLLLVQLPGT